MFAPYFFRRLIRLTSPPLPSIGAGRVDASGPEDCAPTGMLPGAHDTANRMRTIFYRMGFEDAEIVALMGAHTTGLCHPHFSGFNGPWTPDTLSFDNAYFKLLLEKLWARNDGIFRNSDEDGTLMLVPDMQLATDAQFYKWAKAFAEDEDLFFSQFSAAFQKLGELGHSSLQQVEFELTPVNEEAKGDWETGLICLDRNQGICRASLQWKLHIEDMSATASLRLPRTVGWLALGVSQVGRMVFPEASYAVVGSQSGVNKHVLRTQQIASISQTAPLDAVQDLRNASFVHSNGFTTLSFRCSLSWFTRYANRTTGAVQFIYAFGDTSFGYHGIGNRGSRLILRFGRGPSVISAEMEAQVQLATGMIAQLVRTVQAGPTLVRLAWHDAGTYNATDDTYGPRASMRFDPEASYPSNNGLAQVRALLEPVKQAAPLMGYADLWQLAAVVSIEMMGGPRVPFRAPYQLELLFGAT